MQKITAFLSIKTGRPDRQCVIKHLDSLSEEYLQKCHLPFRICWEQEIKEAGVLLNNLNISAVPTLINLT